MADERDLFERWRESIDIGTDRLLLNFEPIAFAGKVSALVAADAPNELKDRVLAAVASYEIGNKGIDHVRRTYVSSKRRRAVRVILLVRDERAVFVQLDARRAQVVCQLIALQRHRWIDLVSVLNRLGLDERDALVVVVDVTRVHLNRPKKRRRPADQGWMLQASRKQVVVEQPNDLWTVDFKGWWTTRDAFVAVENLLNQRSLGRARGCGHRRRAVVRLR